MTPSMTTSVLLEKAAGSMLQSQGEETLFTFHPQQRYVFEIASELGIETKLVYHPHQTDTCHEKAQLLQQTHPHEQWKPERVIKALYGVVSRGYYGFVFPEIRRKLDLETLAGTFIQAQLKPPSSKHDFYFSKDRIPPSMEPGTCTPFLTADDMKGIAALFIYDFPTLDKAIVDISLGGQGELAHKVSLHLPYVGIYDILKSQFGAKIQKVPFPGMRRASNFQETFL